MTGIKDLFKKDRFNIQKLIDALTAGGYNAAPSKLRQGSLHLWFEDPPGSGKFRPGTSEEHDAEYDRMDAERAKSTP
jgi:hypothetical protein